MCVCVCVRDRGVSTSPPLILTNQEEAVDSEDEEAVFLDLSGLKQTKETQNEATLKLEGALESTVDAQEWRLEVERVLPSLKVHIRQDNRVRR